MNTDFYNRRAKQFADGLHRGFAGVFFSVNAFFSQTAFNCSVKEIKIQGLKGASTALSNLATQWSEYSSFRHVNGPVSVKSSQM